LITWDASGNPATVAVGTSGHVLTSNGAGAAPTFQAAGGGGGSATKEFFVDIEGYKSNNGTWVAKDSWHLDGSGSSDNLGFNFFIPHDFSSLTDAVIICIPDATETVQWDLSSTYGAADANYATHTGSQTNATKSVTINTYEELDISSALGSLAANDYCSVLFESDTTNIRVLGLRIKYS
jgi:hypothetical protein